MKDLVTIIIEATKKAATLHMLTSDKFSKLKAHNDRAALISIELKKVLNQELPSFIRVHLKDANDSAIGEAWMKKFINTQCNFWGIQAVKNAQATI